MEKWDVVIIGGGFSGLSAGALLADAGKKVLVLEKGSYLGGRDVSTEYRGHAIDNAIHIRVGTGYIEEIFSRLGKTLPEVPLPANRANKTNIFYDGKWQDLGELYPHDELRKILKEGVFPLSYEQLEEYDDIGLEEWVSQRTEHKGIHLFFYFMGWLMSIGNEYEDCSAGDTFICFKEIMEHGGFSDMGGPVPGGYRTLTRILADALKERGGEIRTNAKVSDVVFEDGKVRGVEIEVGERILYSQIIDTEFIEAPIVISTVPIWDLFNVVNEDRFTGWYVDWVKETGRKYVNVFNITYGMKKIPMGDEYSSWFVPKLPRTGMAGGLMWVPTYGEPVNEYHACAWLQINWFDSVGGLNLINPHNSKTQCEVRRILDLLEEDINELFPGFEENCSWKIRIAAPCLTAESPSAVRKHRPNIHPPGVKNFYLISDTLQEARPGGTASAARVVLKGVDSILGNK